MKIIVDAMGGGQQVVLEVDGTTLGRVAAAGINGITGATGKCPIRVY